MTPKRCRCTADMGLVNGEMRCLFKCRPRRRSRSSGSCRAHVVESEARFPKFGTFADELADACRDALDVGRRA